MVDLSVVIPSRTDQYLQRTVDDILAKSTLNTEVIVVLDGYETPLRPDPYLTVLRQELRGMRAAINLGMANAHGRYVMKTDEHCMFSTGFDAMLLADCDEGQLIVPRRYRLDPDNWKVITDGRPPVDYMRLQVEDGHLSGVEWRGRAKTRADIIIDETPSMQGSCYVMHREDWRPMDDAHYGPFAQEAQEIGMRFWLEGKGIWVNKSALYAHWHRNTGHNFTREQRRAFDESVKRGRAYSYQHWTTQPGFADFVQRFA